MKPLRIIWIQLRVKLHSFLTFHYYNVIWYNGPGYEKHNAIWKLHCNQCPKVYYINPVINAILDRQLEVERQAKLEELENEAVKSRMN